MPEIKRSHSQYSPVSVGVGIVHIGLGAFHRAHQAYYVERWLNANRGGDWGICAANIRSNRTLVELMQAQHGRYHVVAYANRENVAVTEVRSIREALYAGDDPSVLLQRLARPETRLVTLTVTEKAYHLNPATGELNVEAADIVHDRNSPAAPKTAAGLLVEALRRRRDNALPPFTVLCCDNMPENGKRARRAVSTLAACRSPELGTWIENEVPFPSTMVDRIVPAVTTATLDEMAKLIGEPDPAAVACESFTQWVVEDRFVSGRPDWESVGVEMVDDVAPYETLKLRMLNGAHSLLAYVGLQCGKTTVSEAVTDPRLNTLVLRYFREAAASLDPTSGITPEAYANRLLERFGNDALEHQLSQIAMDGSQKLPQRWLQGAEKNLRSGRAAGTTAIGLAAWFAYVRGRNDSGANWDVDDPLAARLAACHRSGVAAEDTVAALMALREVVPETLAEHTDFRRAVTDAYRQSMSGVESLLRS